MNNDNKTEMNDMGEEHKVYKPEMAHKPAESNYEKEIRYPQQSFTTDQIPGLKNAELKDTVKIVIECEVVGIKSGSEYMYDNEAEDKNKTRVTLKMKKGSATIITNADNDKQEENKDTETTTLKEKQSDVVKKFSKAIDVEDENQD